MRLHGLDALLLTHLSDVRYLSGFSGSSAALLLLSGGGRLRSQLFTDGRYRAQARSEVSGTAVKICNGSPAQEAIRSAVESGVPQCGYVADATTVATLEVLRRTAGSAMVKGTRRRQFLRAVPPLCAALREVKDAAEIASLRRAAAVTSGLYEEMLTVIEAGMREIDVAAELEYRARKAGAEAMSFDTIVAAGERSSLPHGRATTAKLCAGDLVTLDFGIMLEGYCSDMTRTVFLGRGGSMRSLSRADGQKRDGFAAVLAAQEAAVQAVSPGVRTGDVDRAARSLLEAEGFGKAFSHSTGHGLGLEIHEGPRIAKDGERVLEPGMVITVEPGVYLQGQWGVRIEDTVLVTPTGSEILTPAFKGWTEL